MLQAQARTEDQAVQLHEKLEAKRAATHAEKVRLLDSKFLLCFHHEQASNNTQSAARLLIRSISHPINQSELDESMFWVCVSTLCMGGFQWSALQSCSCQMLVMNTNSRQMC